MTTPATVAAILDDLQTQVGQMLTKLGTLYPFVRALVNSHQEPYVSFLLPEQLADQNRSYRADRYARDLAASAGHQLPGRESPAPGNLAAISVDALLNYTLHAAIRTMRRNLVLSHPRTTQHTHPNGIVEHQVTPACWAHPTGPLCQSCTALEILIPAEPPFDKLLAVARNLSWAVQSAGTLHQVIRDLTDVHTQAIDLIDGNARIRLDAVYPGVTCPHCKRATLAAFFRDDVIRCDRDPDTETWEPCICPDPFCECKNRPIEFRHDWLRTKPGRDKRSWYALADTFNTNVDLGRLRR